MPRAQHFHAQRYMGGKHQQAGNEGGNEDAEIKCRSFCNSLFKTRQQARNGVVKQAVQIFRAGVPPTLNGNSTALRWARWAIHSEGFASW